MARFKSKSSCYVLAEIEPIDENGQTIRFLPRKNLEFNETRPVCIYKQIFKIFVWFYIIYTGIYFAYTIKTLLKL